MNSEKPIRAIAHFDLDAFFVSVERLKNPSLNGSPLIVGGLSGRGVVAACSYETRKYGVHSAMPMAQALKLCPQAVVIPPGHGNYGHYSQIVTEMIASEAPLFEKASIDEFYLDLTGIDRYISSFQWASNLRKKIIDKTSLPISFALSVNKLVSKIATDTVKPNGQIEVKPGTEKAFLAPMPIEKMPMIGPETAQQLHRIGIFTIGQLTQTSPDTLGTLFGKQGRSLWQRANGIDDSPVNHQREQKSISTENTFGENVHNRQALMHELLRLNSINAKELRRIKKYTLCVAVKIRYADFETITRQMSIPATTSTQKLAASVKALFEKYYQEKKPVRLLGVRYSNLIEGGQQLNLFENDETQAVLYQTIDALHERFGPDSLFSGGGF